MQISESEFIVDESGTLTIPKTVLQEMGLFPGNRIWVSYVTQGNHRNTFREFLLSASPLDKLSGEQLFQVPDQFLEDANIPTDADLQIFCLNGYIVICQDATLTPDELSAVLEQLKAAGNLTEGMSADPVQLQEELAELIKHLKEGESSSDP